MSVGVRGWMPEWEVVARRRLGFWRRLSAPQLFVGSFALLILVGTLGLKLLPGLYTGPELGWLDALFTSTSAVCVTGLIVVDTATFFTPLGQAFLLLLIQLGGLGMITFATVIILVLGRRLSLRHEAVVRSSAEALPEIDYRRLTRAIVGFTFAAEGVVALLLYALWVPRFGLAGAAWPAVFHAVSAFCNAGFSTFSDSLMAFQRAPLTLAVIMAAIVVGGLGFLTLAELNEDRIARRRGKVGVRLSLHSRLALVTTGILLVGGWAAFAVLEWNATLDGMPLGARLVNALFASVTPRTAGFNTIDYAQATAGTNFLTIILMSIGGSPGSTAGGLKTTTFALLGLLAWTRFRRQEIVAVAGRSIPEETVQRAVGLSMTIFTLVTAAILGYTMLQPLGLRGDAFLAHMFEAVSAFNTVGLSMGVTPALSGPAELLTIALMYLGRVGPLVFAAAIALPAPRPVGEFRFAYEDVVVG